MRKIKVALLHNIMAPYRFPLFSALAKFKDIELTNNEHYVDAHIRHKAKLFRENVTADVALPYVGFFSKELLENIQTYATL